MRISVCLIVKNEEEVLTRCLDSVKSFADEIIVVDTGSTDNTRSIAQKYTQKVFEFEWCDDFSKARNFSFSKATCDYLFWIDADDFIPLEEQSKIISLKNSITPADTYMFKYVTLSSDCIYSKFYFYRERLMKNCERARFKGFIHEYVQPFGKIVYSEIEILHKKSTNKNPRRNIDVYNANIVKGGILSSRDKYYFAKEFFYVGEYQTCKEKLLTLLNEQGLAKSELYDCYVTIFKCDDLMKSADVKLLFKALEVFHPTSELLCLIALYYETNKNIKLAKIYYKMAVCAPTYEDKQGFKNTYYDQLFPLLKLVFLLYNEGRVENSYQIHKFLLDKFPNSSEVKYNEEFFNKLKQIAKNE